MSVIHDDYLLQASDPVTISSEENEQDVSLNLEENTSDPSGTVSGVIRNTTPLVGATIAGATVKLFSSGGVPFMHTESGTNGYYSFTNVPAGNYLLSAVKDGFLMAVNIPIVVTDFLPVIMEVVLIQDPNSTKGTIYGTITDTDLTPHAISGASVLLYQEIEDVPTEIASTTTISDGEYVIEDLSAGTYTILFSKIGFYPSDPITVTVTASSSVLQSTQLEPDPAAITGTISGTIKTILGSTIQGAFVGLYTAEDDIPETLVASTYTNTEGQYMFGGIAEGSYIVKAKASDLI